MNKKILSVREHYDIQSTSGSQLGEADGNFFQFPAKFVVQDSDGAEVMHVIGKLISLRREFEMYDPSGNLLAAIKKKMVKLIGSEYWLEQNGNQFARIYGNFVEHDYRIQVNGMDVAQVHKKWVSVRDSFDISVTGSVDRRLVLGSVIVIEHEEVTERRR
ncbi:MAG TPA: LURP-one-related family protein [Nitrososphaerales archaeon]|nr:LURP-one-related family protein [Nitrososphaerales archaeon]